MAYRGFLLAVCVGLCVVLPGSGLQRIGCFVDKASPRDLKVVGESSRMTQKRCATYCKAKGYKYAGLQASSWCFCGNSYGRHGRARDSDCKMRCTGNRHRTCGGAWRNEVFAIGLTTVLQRIGCFVDKASPRDLKLFGESRRTTQNGCATYCRAKGYKYAGLQASSWCTCGNSYGRHGRARDSDCKMRCTGNRRQTCGGAWRNEVFATATSAASAVLQRIGCFVDKSSRDLKLFGTSSRTTQNGCANRCKAKGYKYAGLQASSWCTCGNSYGRHGRARDSDCKMRCTGNRQQTCGGIWRNEVFATGLGDPKGK